MVAISDLKQFWSLLVTHGQELELQHKANVANTGVAYQNKRSLRALACRVPLSGAGASAGASRAVANRDSRASLGHTAQGRHGIPLLGWSRHGSTISMRATAVGNATHTVARHAPLRMLLTAWRLSSAPCHQVGSRHQTTRQTSSMVAAVNTRAGAVVVVVLAGAETGGRAIGITQLLCRKTRAVHQ